MSALALTGVKRLEIIDLPLRAPGPHEVIIRIGAVGLCGTDFHLSLIHI